MEEKKITRKDIGKYIPEYLNDNGVSAERFSAIIGASKSSVYNWVNGGRPSPIFYSSLLELLRPYYQKEE